MVTEAAELKRLAAESAAAEVRTGMVVGLGTGSTADWATRFLAEQKLDVAAVPTSRATADLAASLDIRLLELKDVSAIDVLIDGADECTADGKMIKGGGGALLREKLVATLAKECHYVMDESKVVETLGAFPLPVEVNVFGWELVSRRLEAAGLAPTLRGGTSSPFLTDNGHYILDCKGGPWDNPSDIEALLRQTVGVVETGFFLDFATKIHVASQDGVRSEVMPQD